MNSKEIKQIIDDINTMRAWDKEVKASIGNKPQPKTAVEALQRPYDDVADLSALIQKYNNFVQSVAYRLNTISKEL